MVLGTRAKLALFTLTAVVVGLGVLTVAFEAAFGSAVTVLRQAVTAKCVARASLLASQTAFPVAAGMTEEASAAIDSLMREAKEIRGASIIDPSGRVLISRGEPAPRAILDQLLRSAAPLEDGEAVWAAAPLSAEGSRIGWVLLLQRGDDTRELRARSRILIGFTELAVLALVALAVIAIGRRVAGPLERMASLALRLSEGDLSQEDLGVGAGDEVGQLARAVDQMAEALRRQVGAIKEASAQVHADAGNVLVSARELAEAAQGQVLAVGDATTFLRNAEAAGAQTLESVGRITSTAHESVAVAHEGTQAVERSIEQMRDLATRVELVADRAQAAVESLRQVDFVVAAVNDIAKQSHLLSLNAGLEAARAGELGKGFAVVAREVAALAEGSLGATNQVHSTLGKIRSTIEGLAESARAGRDSAEAAVRTLDSAGKVIHRLSEAIDGTSVAAQEIKKNATDQVAGLKQADVAMVTLDSVAGRHFESVKQAESGCSRLEVTAGQLELLVAHYRVKSDE